MRRLILRQHAVSGRATVGECCFCKKKGRGPLPMSLLLDHLIDDHGIDANTTIWIEQVNDATY